MSIFDLKKSASAKAVSVFVGSAMALTLVFGGAVAPAQAQTVEELTAQISSLLEMISSLQVQLSEMGGETTTPGVSYNFTKNLSQGDSGADVLNLQKVLNMSTDTQVAVSGVGSAGNETEYFGSLTKVAVIKFQDKYASEILTPVGLTAGTGYVGASTRAKLNTMTTAPTTPTTPETTFPTGCTSAAGFSPTTGLACDGAAGTTPTTPVSTGTGITISAGVQPAATLAVGGAARVPFTKIVLTASADGDIVVNSLLIERDALSQDAAFAGIVLLDEDGAQLGIAKTLNSLHQATVGEAFTVKAGTSKTVTVAANMVGKGTATTLMGLYTGQLASLDVIGVNTSAVVNGVLPIKGAQHTLNASLTIGTATAARGIDDPNTSATKEVGVTDYTFAAVKITAGSAEKIRVHSLRWNQSGSVSASDLGNLSAYIDGVAYDLTASADGKYYTVSLGDGIVIEKGLAKEIKIMGDILSGSGRTIIFDIYKATDLYVTGETYGYGITPTSPTTATGVDASSQFTTGTPWYDNAVVTVSNGSLSTSKSTSVEAQNISENVANQPLGGFDIEAKGETVSVGTMIFNVTVTGATVADITNVSLVDSNGSVVAGPVDGAGAATTGTITFTDSVTFPVEKATYTLQGQIGTDFGNDDTVSVATTPSSWSSVTGDTTGNSITPTPATAITANTMTVKAGTATISVSASPVAQNIVAGAQNFVFANYQFDATASGEDVRFTSLVPNLTVTNSHGDYLTGCQLWDGSTALNTGSNAKDIPSTITAATDVTFTLDSGGVTITKGTVKTLALKCNLSSSATASDKYLWKMSSAQSGTGLNSGTTITTVAPTGAGQTMTAATQGTLTVAEQTGAYVIAAAGTTNVTLGSLKFSGTNEAITLKKLALELTDASSTPSDLIQVTLWDGTTKVGSAIFTGSSNYATSTLTGTFTIPKDGNKVLTLKGDLAQIGTSQVGTQGALLKVNYDGDNLSSTQGVGDQSGGTISSTSATSSTFDGVRVFRAYPEFAKVALSSSSLTSGTTDLYKFSVTAKDKDGSSNGIGVYKFTLNLATSSDNATTGSTTVTNVKMYAYTDSSFSTTVDQSADGTAYTSGQVVDTVGTVAGTTTGSDNELELNEALQIPAGTTYYFKVVGTVNIVSGTGTDANNWVKAYITGDSAYEVVGGTNLLNTATVIDGDTNDAFVWSPYATTTSLITHLDWTNGYKVTGLAADGMDSETINQ